MTARTFSWLCAGGGALLLAVACSSPQSAAPPKPAQPEFMVSGTIKDIMDGVVDPSADFLWESVATIVTKKGTEERRPRTDAEWKEVRRRAIALIEGPNLLIMEGRKVAKAGEKSENPGIELGPEEIQQVIDADRTTFIQRAHALQDAGLKALAAIDKKDADALSDAGETIDEACEQCHLKYWYPPDAAEKLKGGAGSVRKKSS